SFMALSRPRSCLISSGEPLRRARRRPGWRCYAAACLVALECLGCPVGPALVAGAPSEGAALAWAPIDARCLPLDLVAAFGTALRLTRGAVSRSRVGAATSLVV